MAKTNHKECRAYKPGVSKQQTAERNFLQAVQNWYAYIPVGQPSTLLSQSWQRIARDSPRFPELHNLLYWYTYGFEKGVVTTDFEYFKLFAKGRGVASRFAPHKEVKPRGRYVWRPLLKTSYSKARHAKMSGERREEIERKREWKKKKDRNDRRHWHRGPNSYDKKHRAAKHRAFVKQTIHREDWEAFYQKDSSGWEHTKYVDPWYSWA